MTREELISALIDDMMDTISNSSGWYLSSICADGFKGFNNYTDEELAQEYAELFENNNLEQG
jgi:hypothetical protein